MPNNIRAFIAIEIPAQVKNTLAGLQARIKAASNCPARWVATEGMHLTLIFLGSIENTMVKPVHEAMQQASADTAPFNLQLGTLGGFPNSNYPRVLWIGLNGDLDILAHLHTVLEKRLGMLGFKAEERLFSPHLTLARMRDEASPDNLRQIGNIITNNRYAVNGSIPVNEINLMQSHLSPAGAVYTRLTVCQLTLHNNPSG